MGDWSCQNALTYPLVHRTQALCCFPFLAVLRIVTVIFYFWFAQISAECTYPLSTKQKKKEKNNTQNSITPGIQGQGLISASYKDFFISSYKFTLYNIKDLDIFKDKG